MDKEDEVNLLLEAEVTEVPHEEAHCLIVGMYAATFAIKNIIDGKNFIFN